MIALTKHTHLSTYLRVFVSLFAVNAQTTARIDSKRTGITKNDTESVLHGLNLPVLVFSGRYRDVSGFSFAADRHFYLSPFHLQLLPRPILTQSAFVITASTASHIATDNSSDYGDRHSSSENALPAS